MVLVWRVSALFYIGNVLPLQWAQLIETVYTARLCLGVRLFMFFRLNDLSLYLYVLFYVGQLSHFLYLLALA